MPVAKNGMLRTNTEVMSNLFQTYAIDDVIAETDAALTSYIQPFHIVQTQYAKAVVTVSRRVGEL